MSGADITGPVTATSSLVGDPTGNHGVMNGVDGNKVDVDLSNCERVFVRAPNWVGDMVMATRAFARIRGAFPNAHVTCGLRPYLRSLLS